MASKRESFEGMIEDVRGFGHLGLDVLGGCGFGVQSPGSEFEVD